MSETYILENVEVVAETDHAVLIDFDGDEEWIPKSQICDDSEVWKNGQSGDMMISLWLAKQKGFTEE